MCVAIWQVTSQGHEELTGNNSRIIAGNRTRDLSITSKGVYSSSWQSRPRATGRHMPYGNTSCSPFLVFALPLPPVVLVLQPPLCGTRSHLAFVTLPLPIPSVAFLKLTASSRLLAPPSGSPKCLRFSRWLTLCTLNIYLRTYLPLPFRLLECVCCLKQIHFVGF